MKDPDDLFTGIWIFDPARSSLSCPGPQRWTQYIRVTADEVSVREELTRGEAQPAVVSIEAKLDGKAYPVMGSPGADVIAYTRTDALTISGVARKNGAVSLRETLTASADGETLALGFTVIAGEKQLLHGTAVFRRLHK